MSSGDCVAGIDIGTTKIVTLIGTRNEFGVIDIAGIGVYPSYGLRKGIVVDIDKTVESIARSVEQAEEHAGIKVRSAFVGIAGGHISSRNSRATRIIPSDDRIVTELDRDMVLEAAQAVDISNEQEILHVIPRGFIIDGEGGVTQPVGMACRRLEAEVHIVTGAVTSIQNVSICVQKAGIEVEDIVLEPIASSKAVLTEAEKEVSVLLVDIGGGTSDLALFINGAIAHTYVLPFGGNHVTQDVAIGLKVPIDIAEQIKCQHGAAFSAGIDETDLFEIDVPMHQPKPYLRKRLATIIEPRSREMFRLISAELSKAGVASILAGGVVLTGGGARLHGLDDLATELFDLPVRVGYPIGVGDNHALVQNPMYATAVGLLRYAFEDRLEPSRTVFDRGIKEQMPGIGALVSKIRSWFWEYF